MLRALAKHSFTLTQGPYEAMLLILFYFPAPCVGDPTQDSSEQDCRQRKELIFSKSNKDPCLK